MCATRVETREVRTSPIHRHHDWPRKHYKASQKLLFLFTRIYNIITKTDVSLWSTLVGQMVLFCFRIVSRGALNVYASVLEVHGEQI